MQRRPVIGITLDHNTRPIAGDSLGSSANTQYLLPHAYSIAVEQAGGLPILLPYRTDSDLIDEYVVMCDGFVLSGGNDYDPNRWGEDRHPQAIAIDPNRESFDRAIIAHIENRNKPVLGICGGCQLINIHRGGSLHQFLPDLSRENPIEHRRFTIEEWSKRHDVLVEPDSKLANITRSCTLSCNSSHKQSINRIGEQLRVVARAPDGVIEAVEDPNRPFFVGVQWHPERQHTDTPQSLIFSALIRAASR
jgi:putative glutamine amidotransferase